MTDLSCEIAMDLMPLVRDGVASEESRVAVLAHARGCKSCRTLLAQPGEEQPPPMDEKKVLLRIRKQLSFLALLLVALGAAAGVSLTGSMNLFYNVLLMPAIGAVGYLALGRRAGWLLPGLFAFFYLWQLGSGLRYGAEGELLLLAPLYWTVLYVGFCALGLLIAALLCFALRREKKDDKEKDA